MSSIAKDADKKTIEAIFAEIGKKISDKYTKTDIFRIYSQIDEIAYIYSFL